MNRVRFFSLPLLLAVLAGSAVAQDGPQAGNPHGTMNLDCNLCHSEGAWQKVEVSEQFDHSATGFNLEGRHAQADCRDCHQDPRFGFVGTSCADCHADIHKGRLGPACEDCHSPAAWVDRQEQRVAHASTSFPLVGAHNRVDCDACHTGPVAGDYTGTPTDCYFCHAQTYEATTNPDHQAVGFGHDCLTCHSAYSSTFGRGDFVHPSSFPLTGGHRALDCAACHSNGFGGTVADCYACHQDDYEGTTEPNHVAAGFPTSCSICHTTAGFEPAQYTHDTTGFPLTGGHRGLDCLSCHQNGYVNTPSDCYSCHQADYERTTDPDHLASGFPSSCADCHGTSAWSPADWDHDTLFPIYSGRHRGEWNACADCHVASSNYAVFECIFCHEHSDQNDLDRKHNEVNDYTYQSIACFQCHPRGVHD